MVSSCYVLQCKFWTCFSFHPSWSNYPIIFALCHILVEFIDYFTFISIYIYVLMRYERIFPASVVVVITF
jgi:hypothetical protein